jgi:hypothetical protein
MAFLTKNKYSLKSIKLVVGWREYHIHDKKKVADHVNKADKT